MVPKCEEFFLPCLKCLSDGEIYTQPMLKTALSVKKAVYQQFAKQAPNFTSDLQGWV